MSIYDALIIRIKEIMRYKSISVNELIIKTGFSKTKINNIKLINKKTLEYFLYKL